MSLYAILNVGPEATTTEIQRNYKKLSRLYHPDKGGMDSVFVRLKQAHDVLVNPILRMAYDIGDLILVKVLQDQNIYQQVADTKEPTILLQQLLMQQQHQHKQQTSHWDVHIQNNLANLQKDEASFQLSNSRRLHDDVDLSLTSFLNLQRTAVPQQSTRVGLEYRPVRNTTCAVDVALSHQQQPTNITIRTSRRFAHNTLGLIAFSGNFSKLDSWNLSLITSRTLLQCHATWRSAVNIFTGQVQMIMLNLKYATTQVRLALGSSPLKISQRFMDKVTTSWTWNIQSSAFKLAIQESIDDWNLKFSLKYNQHWSVILKLNNDDWTLKFPVLLQYNEAPLVRIVLTLMVAHLLEPQMDEWQSKSNDKTDDAKHNDTSAKYSLFSLSEHSNLISRIAEKKRQTAKLVILEARWENAGGAPLTDWLQFWVKDDSVKLPASSMRKEVNKTKDELPPWWKSWWWSQKETVPVDDWLYIRYRVDSDVYETRVKQDDTILLPSSRATYMGPHLKFC